MTEQPEVDTQTSRHVALTGTDSQSDTLTDQELGSDVSVEADFAEMVL